MRKFDRDLMNNAGQGRVANAAMATITKLQDYGPGEQLNAAAAVFLLLADSYGVAPGDAFAATKSLMNGADGRRPEFAAVQEYLEREL